MPIHAAPSRIFSTDVEIGRNGGWGPTGLARLGQSRASGNPRLCGRPLSKIRTYRSIMRFTASIADMSFGRASPVAASIIRHISSALSPRMIRRRGAWWNDHDDSYDGTKPANKGLFASMTCALFQANPEKSAITSVNSNVEYAASRGVHACMRACQVTPPRRDTKLIFACASKSGRSICHGCAMSFTGRATKRNAFRLVARYIPVTSPTDGVSLASIRRKTEKSDEGRCSVT